MPNYYDHLEIDIELLHKKLNEDSTLSHTGKLKKSWVRFGLDYFLVKAGLFYKLVDAGFVRGWFTKFHRYWINILGGRPLRFHDFFALYNNYRMRYQDLELAHDTNLGNIMEQYRRPENIYQLFACTYIYSLYPFSYLGFQKYFKTGMNILEYGCGWAPITTSLATYGRKKYDLTIADIRQFTYHFAKWNLRNAGVNFIDICPDHLPNLKKNYDVTFLMQTMEHLINPLEVVKNITAFLKHGGYFIFDFILSDGKGFDTKEAIVQRRPTLEFIEQNFNIIEGQIKYDQSISTVVAQKK